MNDNIDIFSNKDNLSYTNKNNNNELSENNNKELSENNNDELSENNNKELSENNNDELSENNNKELSENNNDNFIEDLNNKLIESNRNQNTYLELLENLINEIKIKNNYKYNYCFIIYFNDNFKNLKSNLMSIIYQFYKKWRCIIIDDTDDLSNKHYIINLLNEYGVKNKFTIIKNEKYLGENISKYNILNLIKNNEIIINLNSNCWLSNNFVLNIISEKIKKSNNLYFYSSYKNFRDNKIIGTTISRNYPVEILKVNGYRTFYNYNFNSCFICFANLYKNISKNIFENKSETNEKINKYFFSIIENYNLAESACGKVENILDVLFIKKKETKNKNINKKEFDTIIRNMNKNINVIPPIYINHIKECKININNQLNNQLNNFNIINYELISNFNKNYINYFTNINEETNYDHIMILNNNIHILKNFKYKYMLNDNNIKNKDFIYLSFDTNSENVIEFSTQFENNNLEFKEIKSSNENIDGLYAFIVSRKFREIAIDINISKEYVFNKLIHNLKNVSSNTYIENDLTFYVTNNIYFINNINIKDKYNLKNKLHINNYILD